MYYPFNGPIFHNCLGCGILLSENEQCGRCNSSSPRTIFELDRSVLEQSKSEEIFTDANLHKPIHEREVHKRLGFLSKKHQGKVMGILRELGAVSYEDHRRRPW